MSDVGRQHGGIGGGFVVGFPARRDAAASALAEAQRDRSPGFAPADLIRRIEEAFGGGAAAPPPRHFHPADRDSDPTAGWNLLDPDAPAAGFVDPVEEARVEGYAEGYAAAQAEAEAAALRDRALLAQLTDQLRAGGGLDREGTARRLRATVLALVEQLVGEIGVSGERLSARVAAATELLADAGEPALLRVHPDDVALLDGHLPASVFAAGDAGVARGSFVLEAASTIVEDGPALWLEELAGAIDRVPLPHSC